MTVKLPPRAYEPYIHWSIEALTPFVEVPGQDHRRTGVMLVELADMESDGSSDSTSSNLAFKIEWLPFKSRSLLTSMCPSPILCE